MEKVPVTDEIDEFTEAEFNEHPVCLSLAGLFMDEDVYYTYEEYKEHLSECKAFAQANKNYTYVASSKLVFRNIQIHILENKYVFISKAKTPVIHFVIRHPQMVDSIQHFIPPV